MAVTSHWVKVCDDGTKKQESALIGFHAVPGKHTGQQLATIMLRILERAGIPYYKV